VPSVSGATASTPVPSNASLGAQAKVLVIVDENHTRAQAQAQMPYLVSLERQFGTTTGYTAPTHPSLPNYLTIAGGSQFEVTDDAGPKTHQITGHSVFGGALAHGRTARTYNESMTTNCQLTSEGDYAVKHNPWAYFVDERADCQANDLPIEALRPDIDAGALPTVGMVTPNMCNDAHDCGLDRADAFLSHWIPQLMGGPDYTSGNLTIVITFDEGVGIDQIIQTVVINPNVQHLVVDEPLTHAGLSRWLYRAGGSQPQHDAATSTDVGAGFNL
jgi:acid phosphatase